MKKWKKLTVILLAMIMALAMAVPASAATVKINKTKATICTGQTLQLKMVGTKAKPKWSSNSRNAIVNSAGKVTAKARGTATITAKIGKKSYRCLVTVEAPRISSSNISLYKGKTAQLKMLNTKQFRQPVRLAEKVPGLLMFPPEVHLVKHLSAKSRSRTHLANLRCFYQIKKSVEMQSFSLSIILREVRMVKQYLCNYINNSRWGILTFRPVMSIVA